MQTDPIGFGGGMNLYGYVGNDPMNFVDPRGLQREDDHDDDCQGEGCDEEVIVRAGTIVVVRTGSGILIIYVDGGGHGGGAGGRGTTSRGRRGNAIEPGAVINGRRWCPVIELEAGVGLAAGLQAGTMLNGGANLSGGGQLDIISQVHRWDLVRGNFDTIMRSGVTLEGAGGVGPVQGTAGGTWGGDWIVDRNTQGAPAVQDDSWGWRPNNFVGSQFGGALGLIGNARVGYMLIDPSQQCPD